MASNSESPTKGKADRAAVPVSDDAIVPVVPDPAETKAVREAGGSASSMSPAKKAAFFAESLEKGQTVLDSIKMRAEMDFLKLKGNSPRAARSEIRPASAEPDQERSGRNMSKVDDGIEKDKTDYGSAPHSL